MGDSNTLHLTPLGDEKTYSLLQTTYMNKQIKSFIFHATSEGKPHTAEIHHYSLDEAINEFNLWNIFDDTTINSIEHLGEIN